MPNEEMPAPEEDSVLSELKKLNATLSRLGDLFEKLEQATCRIATALEKEPGFSPINPPLPAGVAKANR